MPIPNKYGYCGNCLHGCCCYCENKNCYYCRDYGEYMDSRNCKKYYNWSKYVCFECKRGWSVNREKYVKKIKEIYDKIGKNVSYKWKECCYCSRCNKKAQRVSVSVRYPKKNDKKGWKLLEKLISCEDLRKCKKGTLGCLWYELGGLGCFLHKKDEVRKLIWVPKHINQYDDWLNYMKSEKIS